MKKVVDISPENSTISGKQGFCPLSTTRAAGFFMSATIYRYRETDEGTRGWLFIDDRILHTLELPDRGNQQNISRIPAGEYRVKPYQSPTFGRCYRLDAVPRRTFILIHNGNWAGDAAKGYKTHSAGCILVGLQAGRLSNQAAVLSSRLARSVVETALDWEPSTIKII